MKRIFTFIAAVAGIIAIAISALTMTMNNDLKNLTFTVTDMNLVSDGLYQGKAETAFVKAEVEVTVADHRIIDINVLRHDNGFGIKAEEIVNEMIRMNTHEVETISGATGSSKVIQCAVSDALAKGRIE